MSAGNALQAVRLLHEHKPDGWIEKLSLIVRQVTAEDVLRQCARAFLANGADPCGNHAIDATSARRRAPGALSPLDSVSTVAFSLRKDFVKNCRVHPTHWLMPTQVMMKGPRRSMLN